MHTYTKTYHSLAEQVALLQKRGMIITDTALAEECLRRIGYYRLSAYWYPFRQYELKTNIDGKITRHVKDEFRTETVLKDVVDLYIFDKRLRLLMLDALERIEIAIRTEIALLIGKEDRWAHRNPALLHGHFAKKIQKNGKTSHAVWLERLDDKIKNSKEDFVLHFKEKYSGTDMPVWMVVDLWDFGLLSHFFSGMKIEHRHEIAHHFKIPRQELLTSWLRTLNFIRNTCAHHGRLWNRSIVEQPSPPAQNDIHLLNHLVGDHVAHERIYAAVVITQYMLSIISPSSTWPTRLKKHLMTFPKNPNLNFKSCGFPDHWDSLEIWK